MTQYNTLNVKFSNSQLKLKSAIKNGTEVTLNLLPNIIVILLMKMIVLISYY